MLPLRDNLELLLAEFNAKDLGHLTEIRTTKRVDKAALAPAAPRQVPLTAAQCEKLCEKIGLKYHPGYENRVIERVTTTEAPDRYGDIVRAKGVDNANYRKNPVVLFAHDSGDFPIGMSLKEWIDNGLKGWRSWDLHFGDEIDATGRAEMAFRFVDAGAMLGGSIGFMPREVKTDYTPEERVKLGLGRFGVEYLTCEKLEHSACSVPANPEALSNQLKAIEQKKFKSLFSAYEVDRMATAKMLDEELLDVFASTLGVERKVFLPPTLKPEGQKDEALEVFRPYPNEHAARVRDPGDFEDDSFRRKNITEGVDIILGKLKDGDGSMVAQAYRFKADKFTAEEAKKWLADHDVEYIDFEAASGKAARVEQVVPAPTIVINVNIEEFTKQVTDLNLKIKDFSDKIEALSKSSGQRFEDLLAATQRALTALENRTRSTGLYDREVDAVKSTLKL